MADYATKEKTDGKQADKDEHAEALKRYERGYNKERKNIEAGYEDLRFLTGDGQWEDAAKNAVATAARTLRDLRIAEVSKLDMKVEGGKVVAYRARIMLSFKYDA